MEGTVAENSQSPILHSSDVYHHSEDMASHLPNHEDTTPKSDFSSEEIRALLELIAATGKFWHDWDILKSLLSFQLKQVLAEYPEAQVVSGDGLQQNSISGEMYPELVKQLDEALLSFMEGPPFTLQRLCEILLSPKSTYRTLSKLALALEKNLLVTSTLIMCTDPYPASGNQKPAEADDKGSEEPQVHLAPASNGVESAAGDADEEMVEAEPDEAVPNDAVPNVDTEMQEEVSETLENNLEPNSDSDPPMEHLTTTEQQTSTTSQEP